MSIHQYINITIYQYIIISIYHIDISAYRSTDIATCPPESMDLRFKLSRARPFGLLSSFRYLCLKLPETTILDPNWSQKWIATTDAARARKGLPKT